MHIEVFKLQLIRTKNNFVHFAPAPFGNLSISSVHGLKAESQNGRVFYFSCFSSPYIGSLGNDCMGISAAYALALNLEEGQCLVISTLNNLGSIRRLYVSPLTDDDMQIAYSCAAVIESQLLSQLRIVWPQQVFCTWISDSVSITLSADALFPKLQFGRLEEYTEIIFSLGPRNKAGSSPPTNSRSHLLETYKASLPLQYRCVPIDKHLSQLIDPNRSPPFAVHVIKSEQSSSLCSSSNVWKLTKVGSDEPREVYVQLSFIETSQFAKNLELISKRKSKWPHLFVNESVRRFLKVELGTKVYLTAVSDAHPDENICSILISPLFKYENTPREEDLLVEDVKATLKELALCNPKVLLNNKAVVSLKSGNVVQLTLSPLDLVWSFFSNLTLRDITVKCNEFHRSNDVADSIPKYALDCTAITFREISPWCDIEMLKNRLSFTDSSNPLLSANVLITGRRGCGKSHIVKSLLKLFYRLPYFFHSVTVDCLKIKGKRMEVVVRDLSENVKDAVLHQPSVIYLKNIDAVACRTADEQFGSDATLHVNRLAHKLAGVLEECQRSHAISILGTASSIEGVHSRMFSLRGKSLFSTHFQVPALSKDGRKNIIQQLILRGASNTSISDLKLYDLVNSTENFSVADLMKLVRASLFEAWKRKVTDFVPLQITDEDLKCGLESAQPSYLKGLALFKETKYNWSMVGGLEAAKTKLIEVIIWPTKYPHIMSQCPLKPQMGVLLYGPPGSGKTILARAAANESGLNFITVKGPELMSKYIGQSEEGVRNVFERAQAAKPCILFFDEFESLAPRRGQDQTGVTDRVVNQFLTVLDGIEPLNGVFVMAATSRPDLIDPALLRPGRIGILVPCHFPDRAARLEILSALSVDIKMDEEVDLSVIAQNTEEFSGADLKGLLSSAQLKVIDEIVRNSCWDVEKTQEAMPSFMRYQQDVKLKLSHIVEVLKESKPSLNQHEKRKFEIIYQKFLRPSIVNMKTQKVTLA